MENYQIVKKIIVKLKYEYSNWYFIRHYSRNFLVPTIIYLRGRNSGWDDSNIFGVFHVLCHLALHPDDFTKMQYPDGKKPFWYLTKDEFSDILKNRPDDIT